MPDSLECGHSRFHYNCVCCQGLQKYWYDLLSQKGFRDAEDTDKPHRPLKVCSGISGEVTLKGFDEPVYLIDTVVFQPPHEPIKNVYLENPLSDEERLLHHAGFNELCDRLCSHGNHKLTAIQVREVWQYYLDGYSNRHIARAVGINDTLVWRTVNTLTQWAALMDLDTQDEINLAKVVLRDFQPKSDEAFIYASWRNALWYDDEERKQGDSDRFYRHATASIRNILENQSTKVRIACLSDSRDFIVGYSVITNACLYFVYVKVDYRKKRIGSLLVPRSVEMVSPIMTKIGRAIAIKKKLIKENQDGKAEGFEE